MTKNIDRPSSPSIASTQDDDDAVLIHTPSPSEADTFPDYIHVDMDNHPDEEREQVEHGEQTSAVEAASSPEDSLYALSPMERLQPPTYAESESTTPSTTILLTEKSLIPEPSSPVPASQLTDPEKQDIPGTFPTSHEDTSADDPPESTPDEPTVDRDQEQQQNPFVAAATAAIGLSTLLAIFTARTLYNGATAASSTLYTNFQSDLNGASNDLNTAVSELQAAINSARQEILSTGQTVYREADIIRGDMQEIVRETRTSVRRDVESAWADIMSARADVQNIVREVGGTAVGDLRRTFGDVLNVLREARQGL